MKKFFRDKNLGCHVIAGSPRILGSTFPHLEVPENLKSGSFDLFSDSDNTRPNVGNCFGVELFNKTSSSIKFGTSRTRRMSRVGIHPWRNLDSSKNLEKERVTDLRRSSPCHTTVTEFANGKGQNHRKIGVPWHKSGLPRWRMTAARLGKIGSYLGNSKFGNSTTGKYLRSLRNAI